MGVCQSLGGPVLGGPSSICVALPQCARNSALNVLGVIDLRPAMTLRSRSSSHRLRKTHIWWNCPKVGVPGRLDLSNEAKVWNPVIHGVGPDRGDWSHSQL